MATVSANFSPPPSWPNPNSELISQPSDVNSLMTSARTLDHLNDSDVHDGNDSDDAVSLTHSNLNANFHHRNTLSTHSESLDSKTPPKLLHVSFNQDQACFAAATDNGFRIFNCDPFCEVFRREFDGGGGSGGGIGLVEMLFRCNILSLVGGGSHPLFPPNKVMIWDDNESRCTSELSFRTPVRGVRLRRDRIVVALEHMISVYNYTDLKLLDQIETFANPKGLCEISYLANSLVLVCPGLRKGQVRVEHYTEKKTKFIKAHDSGIACLALTLDGRLVATASTKGTLIRIFNSVDGTLLQEVRRGAHAAEIHSLAISSKAEWLAVSSGKGTVHIFCLKVNPGSPVNEFSQNSSGSRTVISSSSSSFSLIRGVLPRYFSSEWSVAQFRLREGSRYIVAFGLRKDTVIILGMDGSFYRCEFDPVHGGEMTQLEYHNFLKPEEAV